MTKISRLYCLLFLFLILIPAKKTIAQNGMRFSQYMNNELSFNPAYAGTKKYLLANFVYRSQWSNFEGAPSTSYLSLNGPFQGKNVGLGGMVYRERIGIQEDLSASLAYDYHIHFWRSSLSLGLQAGIQNKVVRWGEISLIDPNDATFPTITMNYWVPLFGFGAYYYSTNYYIGFSAPQILNNYLPGEQTPEEIFMLDMSKVHYYLAAGYIFKFKNKMTFKPSFLYKSVKNTPKQIDIDLMTFFPFGLSAGLGIHSGDSYVFFLGYVLNQNLEMYYSYDITYNELSYARPVTNEFSLVYKFASRYERVLSPRYF